MFDFTNQVVVITGAAGNLGYAVAQAFQAAGAKLALVDRAGERLQQLFPELVDAPDHFLAHSVDITDAAMVEEVVRQVVQRLGRIDVLANIAGGFRAGAPVHETALETWDFMLNLNARSVFNVSRAVIPHMLEQGRGKIVNVGARVALQGGATMGAYSVAKAGVLRLTESMAAELKNSGINVNAILPGTIDTPQNRQEMPNADHSRWVAPEAIADVILFLASDAARAVHGAAIPVYGLT